MAKYVANPVIVDAWKITAIHRNDTDTKATVSTFDLTLDDGRIETTNLGMTARMIPKVGDYWVVQDDGYVYLNPKDVFEHKYSPQSK